MTIDCCILRIDKFRHYFITAGGDNEDEAADVPQATLERSAAAEEVKMEVKLTISEGFILAHLSCGLGCCLLLLPLLL